MKKILRQHPETAMTVLAIVFIAIVTAYFIWGINDMMGEIDRAVNTAPKIEGSTGFNLKGAQSLNLKGLSPRTGLAKPEE